MANCNLSMENTPYLSRGAPPRAGQTTRDTPPVTVSIW